MKKIKTLKTPVEGFYSEKGSKFYAYAFPIQTKKEVKPLVKQLKEQHLKANHFCFAYLLDRGKEVYALSNDDGEPKNSAGAPILGQIKSFELSNILVVVLRYFGGTKLGISGLINAYKTSAKDVLNKADFIIVEKEKHFQLQVNYANLGTILSIIDKNQLNVKIQHHTAQAEIIISVKENQLTAMLDLFSPLDIKLHQLD